MLFLRLVPPTELVGVEVRGLTARVAAVAGLGWICLEVGVEVAMEVGLGRIRTCC